MPYRPLVALLAVSCIAATTVRAQSPDPRCQDPTIVGSQQQGGDACQEAIDVYDYTSVQLGTLVAGGNATLGQGGTLGGLGHFAIGVRGNAMRASIPDVAASGVRFGPVGSPRRISNRQSWAGFPEADLAIGLFRGISLGVTHVGGIDALGSASYLPDVTSGSVQVGTSDGRWRFGYGARVGVLEETALVPGVSVTYLRRDLPTAMIAGWDGNGDTVSVQNLRLRTTSWRVVASKNLLFIGLAAGIGQDSYRAAGNVTYDVNGFRPAGGGTALQLDATTRRTNIFGDLSLNLVVAKLVAEVGRVSGGSVTTYNTFDPTASSAHYYGSLGLRVGH